MINPIRSVLVSSVNNAAERLPKVPRQPVKIQGYNAKTYQVEPIYDSGIEVTITDHVTADMEWVSSVALHGSANPKDASSIAVALSTRVNKDSEYVRQIDLDEGTLDSLSLRSLFRASRMIRKTAKIFT